MLRLNKIATPANPASGKGQLFYSSTLSPNTLAFIDESGNVLRVGGLGTKDYRKVKVTEIFNPTTSYTPTSGVSAIFAEAIGAGGGGAGVAQATASQVTLAVGGGGGSYAAVWLTANVAGAMTVAVGAGGTGGVGAANGVAGGDTTLADTTAANKLTAKGGAGGLTANGLATGTTVVPTSIGGAGGASASCVGDMKMDGENGPQGIRLSGTAAVSGKGGEAVRGGPGANAVTSSVVGATGAQHGGGGGGAMDTGTAARNGGPGANGILIVHEYA